MRSRHKMFNVNIISAITLLIICLCQFSTSGFLRIGHAYPALFLCLTVALATHFGEWFGAAWGLAAGIVFDALSNSLCFASICLALIGLISGLLMSYVFNSNFRSAILISLLASLAYFIADWIIHYAFSSADKWLYLFSYAFPSVVYTSIVCYLFVSVFGFIAKKNEIPA